MGRFHRFDVMAKELKDLVLNLIDHLDAMVAYWDVDQVCVFANNAYQDWFGKTKTEMQGMTLEQLLGPLYQKNLPYIQAAYQGQTQVFERAIPTPGGGVRHSLARYVPHIENGQVRGIFVHVADVSALKTQEQELRAAKEAAEHLATHDFLTGLPNRVLLVDRIGQALALAKRSSRMVAGLSIDLDNFKQVNDAHGHAVGDQLLIETAARLKGSLREYDTATRMGGDEFFVLCPEIDAVAQAQSMADRILSAISAPLQIGASILLPTCSIGIALGTSATTPQSLLDDSDRVMYLAKRSGKNRCALTRVGDLH